MLLSSHPVVRKLKRDNIPGRHGNRFWTSSWLLMDYLKRHGLPEGARVMEVGCGWGLAGIYCAKKYHARVTGVDIDPDVFPFLRLHAEINGVQIDIMKKGFDDLTCRLLRQVDFLIGADICFWDGMTDQLRRLVRRALRAKVKAILITDPVRSPFEELGEYCIDKFDGEVLDWVISRPRRILGQILRVES
ncbi:MAG: methyltransferase domain-containing protein [Deltaproteobacteria bacterium]|nr:methyltransferase domain-containing protein [Deltaproteobacteria bacterium]